MLDANNCVLLLNELEDAGWTQRTRDPGDRRRHIVEITAEGPARRSSGRSAAQDTLEDEVLAIARRLTSASSCASCCARRWSALHPRAEEPVAS